MIPFGHESPKSPGPARRKVIVHIAASADGSIARPDGGIDRLTSRPERREEDRAGMTAAADRTSRRGVFLSGRL